MSAFFDAIVHRNETGRQLLAAWIVSGLGAGAKALFARDHDHYVEITRDPAFPAAHADKIRELSYGQDGLHDIDGRLVFLEQVSNRRKLVICGAGHVALCLIRLAVMLNFDVTVIEDREAFSQKARESGAQHVICRPFREALYEIEGDLSTAFVIMTREHEYDLTCLRMILSKPFAYVGMMGSHSRTSGIREQLIVEGFDPVRVNGVHMPIGLRIGSKTPEEIAVSVAAELIQVMNGTDGGELYPEGLAEELANLSETALPQYVLAMIVKKDGEAPRGPGTKMLIRCDGSFLGTVGGGYAEGRTLITAAKMLQDGCRESQMIIIRMKKGFMSCGGEIEMFLLPL